MIPEFIAWSIFFLPLASFVIITFVIRPFFNQRAILAGHSTIITIGISFGFSIWALASVANAENGKMAWDTYSWLTVGSFHFTVGILLDALTAIMLVVVTGVSLMVQIYSVGYMKNDVSYARYYAYMSLFTASMIGLLIASNIIQLYVYWELVGLCSYLLIGFWYHKPAAAAAAKKAFIITRLGDFGFLLAILYLFYHAGDFASHGLNSLEIADVNKVVITGGIITSSAVTLLAGGIFLGAVGKSAQFPLHTWLPDAMEGPTPVSALIHAATMVAAGVFLVARFFPVFEASSVAMNTVAIVGVITAIFAASMGLVMNDIKRVLAYSTISQLGFMMMAIGLGAYIAALFHLFTHAFFKALLFLGSGNVNHASGTFDMGYMGGLRKVMPWTYIAFLIGALSLSGIFPMSGFWSKDEILVAAWSGDGIISNIVFWLALLAIFMTSFYIFRALLLTFEGKFKGGSKSEFPGANDIKQVHLAECSRIMIWPLIPLGLASIAIGFLINPIIDLRIIPTHWLTHFLSYDGYHASSEGFQIILAIGSTVVALSGIGTAYFMYYREGRLPIWIMNAFKMPHVLLTRKYYFDEIYEHYIVTRYLYRGIARALDWLDKSVIDRMVNMVGWFVGNVGGSLRQVQTGQIQGYGVAVSLGVLIVVTFYMFLI